jgi:ectoine hydroxylase-related dioxygenase (phytanoyl-CoA dioxygenase family)
MPDIDAGDYELITWSLEPGDVLLHHPRTVHGARGNASEGTRRRALSARYSAKTRAGSTAPATSC